MMIIIMKVVLMIQMRKFKLVMRLIANLSVMMLTRMMICYRVGIGAWDAPES